MPSWPSTLIDRLRRDARGQVAITVALTLTALIGFAALGTEIVFVLLKHREMQSVADASALAGAVAMGAGNPANYQTEAYAVAAAGNFQNGVNGTTVTINNPPKSGNYTTNAAAVEVIIDQPQTLSMISLFRSATMDVGARAVALAASGTNCVLVLDTSDAKSASLSGGANVTMTGCGLGVNSSNSDGLDLSGGAKLTANAVTLSGSSYGVSGGATITSTKPVAYSQPAQADPYASRAIPAFSGCYQNNLQISKTPALPLNQGVYCGGISVSGGASVTLNSGTYILDGGDFSLSGGSSVSGTSVTIILTTSTGNDNNIGAVSISGGSSLTLSAPTSGALSGMALWVDRRAPLNNHNSISGGANVNITGLIYMPSELVNYSGGSDTGGAICTQLIAYQVQFSGGSTFQNSCAGTGVLPIGGAAARLVE